MACGRYRIMEEYLKNVSALETVTDIIHNFFHSSSTLENSKICRKVMSVFLSLPPSPSPTAWITEEIQELQLTRMIFLHLIK